MNRNTKISPNSDARSINCPNVFVVAADTPKINEVESACGSCLRNQMYSELRTFETSSDEIRLC